MKLFKYFFLENKQNLYNEKYINQVSDKYQEIGKLVKETNLNTIYLLKNYLEYKDPENTIHSIENNIEKIDLKVLYKINFIKIRECLSLSKNCLTGLLIKEIKLPSNDKKNYIVKKFDFINTWVGSVLYFLILLLSVFILKRYFLSDVSIIEIQNIEQKIKEK